MKYKTIAIGIDCDGGAQFEMRGGAGGWQREIKRTWCDEGNDDNGGAAREMRRGRGKKVGTALTSTIVIDIHWLSVLDPNSKPKRTHTYTHRRRDRKTQMYTDLSIKHLHWIYSSIWFRIFMYFYFVCDVDPPSPLLLPSLPDSTHAHS